LTAVVLAGMFAECAEIALLVPMVIPCFMG